MCAALTISQLRPVADCCKGTFMHGKFEAKSFRVTVALVLLLLYTGIALGPLSSIALKSPHVAHLSTGECSGDCDIDGCPLESRINRTCCCWEKKHDVANSAVKVAGDCCAIKVAVVPADPEPACCMVSRPQDPPLKQTPSCCAVETPANAGLPEPDSGKDRQPAYKCNPPCGNGKVLAFTGSGNMEILPFSFAESLPASHVGVLSFVNPPQLSSRVTIPPDPPPKKV